LIQKPHRDFAIICQRAGLDHWHPHELRHSAASLMLASGVKLQVVSEVLGHASIRMTADVYGHILAPDREAAADAMDQALWNGANQVANPSLTGIRLLTGLELALLRANR